MSGRGVDVLRMVARVWGSMSALALALFFVEHLEWFTDLHRLPPGRIFVAQGFHLALILGLVTAWRWEVPGALLAILAAAGFVAAAQGGGRLALVVAIAASPAVLFLLAAWWEARLARGPEATGSSASLP